MNICLKKTWWLSLTSLCLVSATALAAPATDPAPTSNPAATTRPGRQPADMPAVKLDKKGQPDKRFLQLHEEFLKRGKAGDIGLLFLGDSITEFWKSKARDLFATQYDKYKPANFGCSGDRTEHVLWRIDNGELDGISPKVLVLMIGTNNATNWPAADIVKADTKIVSEIHEKLPETKVLLLGIFPRGSDATAPGNIRLRGKLTKVNAELAKLDDGSKTRYLDIGEKFLQPDGSISKDVMPDGLHPSLKGYEIWVNSMQPLLDEMMK